jgi:hypothetical protein
MHETRLLTVNFFLPFKFFNTHTRNPGPAPGRYKLPYADGLLRGLPGLNPVPTTLTKSR